MAIGIFETRRFMGAGRSRWCHHTCVWRQGRAQPGQACHTHVALPAHHFRRAPPLRRAWPPHGWLALQVQVASALTARHIGGAVNYMAVSESLSLDASTFGAGLAADDLILTLYFTTLYALAKTIPPDAGQAQAQAQQGAAGAGGGHGGGGGKVITVRPKERNE